MYYVSKRMEIAGAHYLDLSYESKCSNLHGHNWIVTVHCKAKKLSSDGMVVDFTQIKRLVHEQFDHKCLNAVPPFDRINPTAENMARHICDLLASLGCYKVEVQESEGNIAVYEVDHEST